MAEPAILIDISYYQPVWSPQRLKEIGGDGVIVKSTMGYGKDAKLDAHAAAVNGAGLALGLYHWLDPTGTVTRQINLLSAAIDKHQPRMVWIDIEQCWSSWAAYWNYIGKEIPWADVPKYDDGRITRFARIFMQTLKEAYPQLHIGIYTGKWFVDSYAPSLVDVLKDYPLWIAQYNSGYKGAASDARVAEIVRHASERHPVLPRGCTAYELWQITSSIKIDGLVNGQAVDFNISRADQVDFMASIHGEVVEPPEQPLIKIGTVTARNSLRIRAEPSTSAAILGRRPFGSVVQFYDGGDWLQLADQPGWVSAEWVRKG